MRATSHFHLSSSFRLFVCAAIAIGHGSPALAWGRQPAPIVYKGDALASENSGQGGAPSSAPSKLDRASQRVSFSYPGTTAPVQASQPSTQPRQYASIDTPQALTVSAASDRMLLKFPGTNLQETTPPVGPQRIVAVEPAPSAPIQPIEAASLEPIQESTQSTDTEQGPTQLAARVETPANTYQVAHATVPMFDETGPVVVFGSEFANMPTANGEVLNQSAFMGAHPSLPLPSLVQVTNAETGQEVIVRVNDRGPYEDGAILQVTEAAARALGLNSSGQNNVSLRYLGAAPTDAELAGAGQPEPLASQPPLAAPLPAFPQNSAPKPLIPSVQQPILAKASFTPVRDTAISGQKFFVQVGAFSEISNAQDMEFLLRQDFNVVISPARVNGSDFFRVRVGPLPSRDVARRVSDTLQLKGIARPRIVTEQ